MTIKDLQARQGNVELVATVTEMGETKEFEKFGKTGKVSSATIQDETGTVKLSLWNEQIDKLKVGDKIHIQKGYVNEFKGELQLTTGKFGTLDIVEGDDVPVVKAPEPNKEASTVNKPSTETEGLKESATRNEIEPADIEEENM